METWPYPRWIAHRGAGKLAPENTLAAFRLGASHGYRMFECDAKLSADGVPFLMHDATLTRTTNGAEIFGPGPSATAGDHDWSELARLDAGGWHSSAYAGEPLPTLENVSRFCMARTGEVVARHADRLWNNAPIPPLLTSFQPQALQGALDTAPGLPRGLLLDALYKGWLETALSLDCVAVVCNHALWDASTLAQARSAGLRCLSYTVNDQSVAQRLIDLGTDGIITDRVDLFTPT
jgi:glycerophosphoryl diester phosphodiesterase